MPAGRADAPHSWTYVPDVGALAARLATDDDGWGRAWHVPTAPARTFDEAAADVARLAGVKPRRVRVLPRPLGTAAGLVVPFMRELRETRHQFERPFVLDSDADAAHLRARPTPWEEALARPSPRGRRPRTHAARADHRGLTRPAGRHTPSGRGSGLRAGPAVRQCDCWRIRLVSSVTWL